MKQMKKLLCGLLMVCMMLTGIGIMPQTVQAKTASVFIAKVKYRKLQPPFVGNCRINGWGKCRF